jgi:hypothetical protein
MDIPRIFNITESAHRIHNPLTPEKLALSAGVAPGAGTSVLDLARFGECCEPGRAISNHWHRIA